MVTNTKYTVFKMLDLACEITLCSTVKPNKSRGYTVDNQSVTLTSWAHRQMCVVFYRNIIMNVCLCVYRLLKWRSSYLLRFTLYGMISEKKASQPTSTWHALRPCRPRWGCCFRCSRSNYIFFTKSNILNLNSRQNNLSYDPHVYSCIISLFTTVSSIWMSLKPCLMSFKRASSTTSQCQNLKHLDLCQNLVADFFSFVVFFIFCIKQQGLEVSAQKIFLHVFHAHCVYCHLISLCYA